ncbi:MAG: hypothetical protein IJW80_03935 [Alistipes sp.]|nr:hypothetical protein [Alistipes sp.]
MKKAYNVWGGVTTPAYEAPEMSIVSVKVESGFATSGFEGDGQTPELDEENVWG